MQISMPSGTRLVVRLLTALVWLAALASIVFWTLRLLDYGKPAPANARELSADAQAAMSLSWPALAPRLGVTATQQQAALDVKVLGVVLQTGAVRTVLSLDNGKQSVVAKVGGELPDGSKVSRITAQEVVLLRNGGEVSVPVPEAKDARQPAVTMSPMPRTATAVAQNVPGVTFTGNPPPQTAPQQATTPLPPPSSQQAPAQAMPAGARDR
jgi:hypothetical protein